MQPDCKVDILINCNLHKYL